MKRQSESIMQQSPLSKNRIMTQFELTFSILFTADYILNHQTHCWSRNNSTEKVHILSDTENINASLMAHFTMLVHKSSSSITLV